MKEVGSACLDGRAGTIAAVRPVAEGCEGTDTAWRALGRSGAAGSAVTGQQRDDCAQGEAVDLRAQLCTCSLRAQTQLCVRLRSLLSRCCSFGCSWGWHGSGLCDGMRDGSGHAWSVVESLSGHWLAADWRGRRPLLALAAVAHMHNPARCVLQGGGKGVVRHYNGARTVIIGNLSSPACAGSLTGPVASRSQARSEGSGAQKAVN